jgi:hypothetical protein
MSPLRFIFATNVLALLATLSLAVMTVHELRNVEALAYRSVKKLECLRHFFLATMFSCFLFAIFGWYFGCHKVLTHNEAELHVIPVAGFWLLTAASTLVTLAWLCALWPENQPETIIAAHPTSAYRSISDEYIAGDLGYIEPL